jgi:hypothetical protein
MMETGHVGVLTFIDYGNWPSLRTHLRFGFKPVREVLVLRIFGKLLSRACQSAGPIESQLAGAPVR